MRPDRNHGETLVEVLAAILIFTFGSIVMMTMFSAAKRVHLSAQNTAAEASTRLIGMELGGESKPGTVTVTLGGESETVEAVFFGESVWQEGNSP